MKNITPLQTVKLTINGLGISVFSPFAVAYMKEGQDYFTDYHQYFDQAVHAMNAGTVMDIATGTPGDFSVEVFLGKPNSKDKDHVVVELGMLVSDSQVHIRDTYDFWGWFKTPPEQIVKIPNGFYKLTVGSSKPSSGIWGDNQTIHMYFEKTPKLPKITYEDFPFLYKES